MTNKEAIANLNHIYGIVSPDIQRSLDVAIKALERPTGDLISRESLKEAVKNRFDNSEYFPFHFLALIDNAQAVERPQGEWICPNCNLYDQVEDDYCQYAGECTIGCRECRYFKQKGGAE